MVGDKQQTTKICDNQLKRGYRTLQNAIRASIADNDDGANILKNHYNKFTAVRVSLVETRAAQRFAWKARSTTRHQFDFELDYNVAATTLSVEWLAVQRQYIHTSSLNLTIMRRPQR